MKLIKINTGHYIIVDDSEIKEGDWYVHNQRGVGLRVQRCVGTNLPMDSKKITHSTQPIEQYYGATDGTIPFVYHKIIELPLSEVKELIGEVNVSKKAAEYANSRRIRFEDDFNDGVCNGLEEGYSLGYNQALEDNKDRKYTEEDLRKAWNAAYIDAMSIDEETYKPLFFEDFIQSLQPKTEWEVEIVDGKLKLK